MGRLSAAMTATGVLGTGGAATLGAHAMGAFGGGGGKEQAKAEDGEKQAEESVSEPEAKINPQHQKLLSEGFSYTPLQLPSEDVPSQPSSWGCMQKLFPEDLVKSLKHGTLTTTIQPKDDMKHEVQSPDKSKLVTRTYYFDVAPTVINNLTACALFDLWEGDNKTHFRSEVAFHGDTYGWVMWNGLAKDSKGSNFEYRFLAFKKDDKGAWIVDKGFGWSTPVTDGESKLHVTIPIGDWTIKEKKSGDYSTRKTWAGLAQVDPTSGQHPLKSLEIYMKKNGDEAEFFGRSDGKWLEESNRGYGQANRMYVVDKGWYTIEKPVDLGFTLTEWYQDLMKKKIGWNTCDGWTKEQDQGSKSWEPLMQKMCYTKTQESTLVK